MNSPVKNFLILKLLNAVVNHLNGDPINRARQFLRLARWLDVRRAHTSMIDTTETILKDPTNPYYQFILGLFSDLSEQARKSLFMNLLVRSGVLTNSLRLKLREKYDMNIPWAILMDPTSLCNLSCTGCWASEYGHQSSLSYELMDRIIREGKELGIYLYIFSGGEPLVRKYDLLRLVKEHHDCYFLAFTNGTLVDDAYAMELAKVGNFSLALSIEGFKEETDMRRGNGTYLKVLKAMEHLQKHKVLFGASTCYHKKNTESLGSEAFIDDMIDRGCKFAWYFTYMPVGKSAVPDLIATPDQREFMYHRLREWRQKKPLFLMDFWNDGEFVGGCIAGGRRYLHINANGDVEPCAFIHYSNINIKEHTLLEALQQPLFKAYHKRQPFNHNHLRPCPCLDNPHCLREMVKDSKASSTQLKDHESVETLTGKCISAADAWAPVAAKLWRYGGTGCGSNSEISIDEKKLLEEGS